MATSMTTAVIAAPQRKRRWLRWVWALLIALLLWLAMVALAIWSYADNSDSQKADAIVLLGASVVGTEPTPVFAARIDHAIDLYRQGRAPLLVLTGGTGSGDTVSEAQAAQQYMLARGIPDSAMQIEAASRTTAQNLRNAKPLLASAQAQRVLLVSDPLHMRRAVVLARRMQLDAHPSPTPTTRYVGIVSKLGFLARETWFYALALLGVAV